MFLVFENDSSAFEDISTLHIMDFPVFSVFENDSSTIEDISTLHIMDLPECFLFTSGTPLICF